MRTPKCFRRALELLAVVGLVACAPAATPEAANSLATARFDATPALRTQTPNASTEEPPAEPWPPTDSASGVKDAGLAALLTEYWMFRLSEYPVWATELGVHRFDDRVTDVSEPAYAARRKQTRDFLARGKGVAGSHGLSPSDRTTIELFVEELESDVAEEVCEFELWSLSPRSNPVTRWNDLADKHPIRSPRDAKNLAARYRAIPKSIDDEIANLRRGSARNLFANAHSGRLVAEMFRRQLGQPLDDWPLLDPAEKEHPGWPAPELSAIRKELRSAVETGIRPAFLRYLEALEKHILPKARGPAAEGLGALPLGKACYAARARADTTVSRTPPELHAVGEREIRRIDRELTELGARLFGTRKLFDTLSRLRGDPKLYFATADEIVEKAQSALSAAKAQLPRFFGLLPKADCVVRRIPDYEAPYTTIAYYEPPVPDGSRPGQYFVNVLKPETRPRFEAEVLAFHESIPGHHLQIAISQELDAMPAFRKHSGMTAFVEGWGLYTERLANEMGLYTADLDRMGMLSFDAWRAARLVVDTGIHAFGWTRARAEAYMLEHTALAPNNVKNEVDRYIVWPGQALAYKTGQLEILRLRAHAEKRLGAAFDLRAFHDVVLSGGAVTLPVLERRIAAWIDSRKSSVKAGQAAVR